MVKVATVMAMLILAGLALDGPVAAAEVAQPATVEGQPDSSQPRLQNQQALAGGFKAQFRVRGDQTVFRRLMVVRVPADTTITLPVEGLDACPLNSRTLAIDQGTKAVHLEQLLQQRELPVGTVVGISVSSRSNEDQDGRI